MGVVGVVVVMRIVELGEGVDRRYSIISIISNKCNDNTNNNNHHRPVHNTKFLHGLSKSNNSSCNNSNFSSNASNNNSDSSKHRSKLPHNNQQSRTPS